MSEYTPTTEDVRELVRVASGFETFSGITPGDVVDAFDRWLAAHDAEKQAEALIEFADSVRTTEILFRRSDGSGVTVNDLLRERAAVLRDTEGKAE